MEFQALLQRARSGGGILFCGAGFSTDCLNFNNAGEIGSGKALLGILNQLLKERGHKNGFNELGNAADEYMDQEGEYALMQLLVDQYKISNITEDMVSIVAFPWDRIYTTNYDNAIEQACILANRSYKTINNLERIEDVPGKGIEIVHLHGYVEKWDIHNFKSSCILGTKSYSHIDQLRPMLAHLRNDFERASVVVFIGFSFDDNDLHLEQVLYNVSSIRQKYSF